MQMAEESDEALEISSNEEFGTNRDDTKESMDQSTSESLQSGSPTVIFAGSPKISNSCRLIQKETSEAKSSS